MGGLAHPFAVRIPPERYIGSWRKLIEQAVAKPHNLTKLTPSKIKPNKSR
jgi:hypothetical protein